MKKNATTISFNPIPVFAIVGIFLLWGSVPAGIACLVVYVGSIIGASRA